MKNATKHQQRRVPGSAGEHPPEVGDLVVGRPDQRHRHDSVDRGRSAERPGHEPLVAEHAGLLDRGLSDSDHDVRGQEAGGAEFSLDDQPEDPKEHHVRQEVQPPAVHEPRAEPLVGP